MVMCTRVDAERKQLSFRDFPDAVVDYVEEAPADSSDMVSFNGTDEKTGAVFSVFIRGEDLREIGVSLTNWKKLSGKSEQLAEFIKNVGVVDGLLKKVAVIASEHLSPPFLTFFTDRRTLANRFIQGVIYSGSSHSSGTEDIPGVYVHRDRSLGPHVFINLKKTRPLGVGGYGKVRKAIWLSAPDEKSMLVAKKVFKSVGTPDEQDHFRKEIQTLRQFRDQRGIIEPITSGTYEGKYAMFLPIYECDVFDYMVKSPFPLTLNEKLSITSQWLEGLSTVSQKGVHGDLSSRNLLLRRGGKEGIEAVISDFGTFCPFGEEQYGLTTNRVGSPEYFSKAMVTHKQDVWALGISLHIIFSKHRLPCWGFSCKKEIREWASSLPPDWVLDYPIEPDAPRFLSVLINSMLDPRPDYRISAKEAFEYFSREIELLKVSVPVRAKLPDETEKSTTA